MGVNVRLAIDRIVVDGLDPQDVSRFRSALVTELQRRAETVDDWSTFSVPTDAKPIVTRYSSRPEDAAAKVSEAIFARCKP